MNGTMDAGEPTFAGDNAGETQGDVAYGLGFSLALLLLLVTLSYASYICKRSMHYPAQPPTTGDDDDHDNHFTRFRQGLSDDVLVTFPTFVYSEAMMASKGTDHHTAGDVTGAGCSICLADYKPVDVLRLLPECGHLFHRKCVDKWLKVHPTCPVCRNSPLPTPLAGKVALSIESTELTCYQ